MQSRLSQVLKDMLGYNTAFFLAREKDRLASFFLKPKLISRLRRELSLDTQFNSRHKNLFIREGRDHRNTIWVYWHRGWENAPNIVKFVNLKNKASLGTKFNFVKLSFELLPKYLPFDSEFESMVGLHREGGIGTVQLVDYIRLRLIATQGGTWLDSTVLVNGLIFEATLGEKNFFLNYQGEEARFTPRKKSIVTWAFRSNSDDPFLTIWADALSQIWQSNRGSFTYFDSFTTASYLLSRGFSPKSSLDPRAQTRILERSNSLMWHLAARSGSDKLESAFRSNPLHKLSHKISSQEESWIVDALNDIC